MKNIKIFIISCYLITAQLLLNAQSFVYLNDTVTLSVQGVKFGEIQWQQSDDTITWTDITGATGNDFPIVPNASYFYRARVSSGTCIPFYSDKIWIEVIEFQCGDTLIDYRDGQLYPTVLIGSQCWFAKNLNVGIKINNGSITPSDNEVIEKYCYNNDTNYCNTNGGLYDWNEMMQYSTIESSQGICPCGWHVPSDQELIKLEMTLGMDSATANLENTWRGTNQGTQLKAGGSSGYNALLSGRAIPGGSFSVINQYEYIYTSTASGICAWRRCLYTSDATVGRWNTFPKSYGLSVRCVKN